MSTTVVKRDGTVEDFSCVKIKRMVDWACEDLEVNPLALEAKFDEFLSNELPTKSIQEHLIMSARMLANADEPDWTIVAGRLWTMLMWKERNSYTLSLKGFLDKQVLTGEYYGELITNLYTQYSDDEFRQLSEMVDMNKDLKHSYGSVLTAYHKYLSKTECLQHMFMINAMIIGGVEEPSDRLDFVKELYAALSDRKLSLATPWNGNLRQGGNISSCFIIEPKDSIESIFDNIKNAALISKNGGGLGISLGRIRAEGSTVNGRDGASKGVFGWARILNDVALFVDQGGKRSGAFTVNVPVWHRDIEGFLEIQSETGELRNKAFDIFPQVAIHDYFMELDQEDGNSLWHTFCPHEVESEIGVKLYESFGDDFKVAYEAAVKGYGDGLIKNVKIYKVRDLIKMIMTTQFDSGLPYLSYIDTINNDNPNNHEGTIPSVNLCIESFSVVKPDEYAHSCNLASVVAGRCKDLAEVSYISALATRVLDNGIAITNNPLPITKAHNERYRTIGVGVQGFADWLAKEGKSYGDKEAVSHFMEAVQFGAVHESIKLAVDRGAYPAFKGSKWDTGEQFDKYLNNQYATLDWKGLRNDCMEFGIRNSQLTSPAPNTTTSIFMDAGAGVMPTYGGFYQKDNGSGMFPFASMFVKENPAFYAKNASDYDVLELVEAVAEIQKYTDAGISTEYFMNHNKVGFSAKELYLLIVNAWKCKTKGLYYIRHIKKGKTFSDEVSITSAACEGCSD